MGESTSNRAPSPTAAEPWDDTATVIGASPARVLRTLRHLRPRQLIEQVRNRVRLLIEDPTRRARLVPPPPPAWRSRPRTEFLAPSAARWNESDLARGAFKFVGETRELGSPPNWDAPGATLIWAYNLHYFEYLWSLSFAAASNLALDWISRHSLDRGRVGWAPYPTSLRLQNWCAYFFGDQREKTEATPGLRDALWRSIFLQAEWLCGHLEMHLLGNHLFENAAALATCGSCFEGEAANRWRRVGSEILAAELREQVLRDGGHFERSPMYQLRVVYVLTALWNGGDEELRALVDAPLRRLLDASLMLSHPDGGIALLNDSAFGIYPETQDLADWWGSVVAEPAPARADGGFALSDTGYYGARHPNGHYLICDAGPIGPDYLPGHAHGDMFSFELSLFGHRVLCDTGVFGYEADALRQYSRSTRAHNTVEVAGQDQCEFWSAFRVARRGRPRDVVFERLEDGFRLSGWHDGYERLPGRPRHRREFLWSEAGTLRVRDVVDSRRPTSSVSRLHLHPTCELVSLDGQLAEVRAPFGTFWVGFAGRGTLGVERSIHCPEFGVKIENQALAFVSLPEGGNSETVFCVTTRSRDDARTLSQSLLLS